MNVGSIFTVFISSRGLLSAMRSEYASKYTDLLRAHDSLKSLENECRVYDDYGNRLYFVPPETLNFVDSALKWNLQDDKCMTSSFQKVMARIAYTKSYFPKYYEPFFPEEYPVIHKFLSTKAGAKLQHLINSQQHRAKVFKEWSQQIERRQEKNQQFRKLVDIVTKFNGGVVSTWEKNPKRLDSTVAESLRELERLQREMGKPN
jgi:hypothetical protein